MQALRGHAEFAQKDAHHSTTMPSVIQLLLVNHLQPNYTILGILVGQGFG